MAGGACTTNPGAPCKIGVLTCQGDQQTCVDAAAATDGTTCATGMCTRGACLAPVTAISAVDLSTTPISTGRTCAESPAYSVTALSSTSATLATAPDDGCLAGGDEVLLINLQGAPGATVNVGNWELLSVASASATGVTFTTGKTASFGATAGSDAGIGIGATDQKVALVRVAQFGALSVTANATLTTSPWNGLAGGVIALRAASAQIDGTISVAGAGYRDGRWSQDDASCTDNLTTDPGESIAGTVESSTSANFGGPGGIGAANGISFISSEPINSGASHATVGGQGIDHNGRTVGAPGATYGVGDGSKLTLGSGGSGQLTCDSANTTGPIFKVIDEKLAGGIIVLLADQLTVGTTGSISASAAPSFRDLTASGGYVFIRGGTLSLGSARVTAVGGTSTGSGVNNATITAGDGYIVVHGANVTGTTSPAASL
jgi:hypothetical protein